MDFTGIISLIDSEMEVTLMKDDFMETWNKFIMSNPFCNIYHHPGWKYVIENTYDNRCFYLMATEGGEIVGILPLTLIKSRLLGASLTSLPYLDFAGIAAVNERSEKALLDRSLLIASQNGVDYLELRQLERLSLCRASSARQETSAPTSCFTTNMIDVLLGTCDGNWTWALATTKNLV